MATQMEVRPDELRRAMDGRHGGRARLGELMAVSEEFCGQPVLQFFPDPN